MHTKINTIDVKAKNVLPFERELKWKDEPDVGKSTWKHLSDKGLVSRNK